MMGRMGRRKERREGRKEEEGGRRIEDEEKTKGNVEEKKEEERMGMMGGMGGPGILFCIGPPRGRSGAGVLGVEMGRPLHLVGPSPQTESRASNVRVFLRVGGGG